MASSSVSNSTVSSEMSFPFRCPVCFDIFQAPKVLNCGHTLCLPCAARIAGTSGIISCPECRAINRVAPNSLKTNVQLQRAVDIFRAIAESSKHSMKSLNDTCPHVIFTKSLVSCPHCDRKFCRSCKIVHVEFMKNEICSMSNTFDERTRASVAAVDRTEIVVKKRARLAKEKIEKDCNKLSDAVQGVIEERKKSLVDRVTQVQNRYLQIAENLTNRVRTNQNEQQTLASSLNGKSCLTCSIEDTARIYSITSTRNMEISALERISDYALDGAMVFNQDVDSLIQPLRTQFVPPTLSSTLNWEYRNEVRKVLIPKLHLAAKRGDVSFLRENLLEPQWSDAGLKLLVNHRDERDSDRTMLIQAAIHGNLDVVRLLLQSTDPDVYIRERNSSMAIHAAAECGNFEIVKALITAKPDLAEKCAQSNITPLQLAILAEQFDVAELLAFKTVNLENREAGFERTALHLAARMGRTALTSSLLYNGADPFARDKQGFLAVHLACYFGHIGVVSIFLRLKPELLSEKTRSGKSLQDLAKEGNRKGIGKLLREMGRLQIKK